MKKCIICRKDKENFNIEHVIPAAVGGNLHVHSVCIACNKHMGDFIDLPFSNHKLISFFRHKYGTQRGNRQISNPFAKQVISEGDKKYTIVMNSSGQPEKYLITKFPKVNDIINGEVSITVDKKSFTNPDEIIAKVAKNLSVPFDDVILKNIQNEPRLEKEQILIQDENNILLLEFFKILYEYANLKTPEYFNDPIANRISQMLKFGVVNKDLIRSLMAKKIDKKAYDEITSLTQINPHHLIGIVGTTNIGLIGFVKIFELDTFFCLLSSDQHYHLYPLNYYQEEIDFKTS